MMILEANFMLFQLFGLLTLWPPKINECVLMNGVSGRAGPRLTQLSKGCCSQIEGQRWLCRGSCQDCSVIKERGDEDSADGAHAAREDGFKWL